MVIAGVVALASPGSQQKVSLFHSLQLRFSSLRPSSNDPAHLEKTSKVVSREISVSSGADVLPVHMLKRFSTLRVSTLWMSPTSTVSTGASNLEGMLARGASVCGS